MWLYAIYCSGMTVEALEVFCVFHATLHGISEHSLLCYITNLHLTLHMCITTPFQHHPSESTSVLYVSSTQRSWWKWWLGKDRLSVK